MMITSNGGKPQVYLKPNQVPFYYYYSLFINSFKFNNSFIIKKESISWIRRGQLEAIHS